MSSTGQKLRFRVLLAKYPDESQPIVVSAADETIWDHSDETLWSMKEDWPEEYEWREVWVSVPVERLAAAFEVEQVDGEVAT